VYTKEQLIEIAGTIDEGFQVSVLVQMLSGLDRFTDDQITAFGVEPTAMRDRFHHWLPPSPNPPDHTRRVGGRERVGQDGTHDLGS